MGGEGGGQCPIVLTRKPCVDQPRIYWIMSCIDAIFQALHSQVLEQDTHVLQKDLKILLLGTAPPLSTWGGNGLETRPCCSISSRKINGLRTCSNTNRSMFKIDRSRDCWMTFSSINRLMLSKDQSMFSKGRGSHVLTQKAPDIQCNKAYEI